MMTVEELKKEGAIYFEKVTDGMQQYENQIIRMNAFQAVDKFMEMWEMLGCKNMYVDFYYFTLPEQADRYGADVSGIRIHPSDGA